MEAKRSLSRQFEKISVNANGFFSPVNIVLFELQQYSNKEDSFKNPKDS